MLFKLIVLTLLGIFSNLMGNDIIFAETFHITIPLDATTSNINEPFVPSTINVPTNSSVIWKNNDTTLHTVTSINETLNSISFDSGLLSQGQTYKLNFNKIGTFSYKCILHPFMMGNIIVGSKTSIIETAEKKTIDDIKQVKEPLLSEENPIILNAKEISGTYVWGNNGVNNPTLNLLLGGQYNFIIKSQQQDFAEHEFKIVLPDGEDIVEAEEVEEGEETQVSFTPRAVDSLKYYCEYHPQSMVGVINIVNNKK